MTIFLLWPMLRPLADSKALLPLLGVLIALAIFPINWPLYKGPANTAPYFELHRTTWYFPIFVIGYWYGRNKFGRENPRAIAPILTGFIFLAAIAAHRFVPWPGGVAWTTLSRSVRWIGYLAAGFCVVWFCSLWGRKQGRIQSWLANVGFYSYDIYLFHVIVGHAVVLVLIKSGIAAAAGWLIVPVAIALTIFISWVIGYFIRRLPKLAFVMLGVPLKRRPRPAKAPAEQARIK
ncbi:MAG: acyltransferase, partial [Phycisphaerae bacterium]|nr:acyltransferase [Phycisphaerae bacterium]